MLILLLKDGNLRGLGTGASLCDGDRGVCPRRVAVLCKQRIMLTGTPLQNDLQELQNLLGFLLPDVFKDDAAAHLADVQVSPTAFGIPMLARGMHCCIHAQVCTKLTQLHIVACLVPLIFHIPPPAALTQGRKSGRNAEMLADLHRPPLSLHLAFQSHIRQHLVMQREFEVLFLSQKQWNNADTLATRLACSESMHLLFGRMRRRCSG